MTVFEFFQKALTLNEGEKMLIPCLTPAAQESMRVRLYQLRKQAREDSILITKLTSDGNFFITLQRITPAKAFILRPDGEIIQVEGAETPNVSDTSLERIVQTAKADKYPVEDLILDLQETFSKNEIEAEWKKQEEETNV